MNWKYYEPKFEYEEKFLDLKWPWAGHKYFAYDLVRNFKPQTVVELGTHYGTSFFSFCQAAKDGGLDTELFAVDTWKGDEQAGFYGESVFKQVSFMKNTYYPELKISFLRKTFNEALADFPEKSIDLLHIDGLHTYEAVKHDYESWLGKVKEDGVVLLHDVAEKSGDFGVYRLWDKIKEKKATFEFGHSHGLGVVFLDKKKLEKINFLEDAVQKYYALSADNRRIKSDLLTKEHELGKLEEVIREKDKQIEVQGELFLEKEIELKQRNYIIELKERDIKEKREEINLMKLSKFWIARNMVLRLQYLRFKDFKWVWKKLRSVLSEKGISTALKFIYKYIIHGRSYFEKDKLTLNEKKYRDWIENNELGGRTLAASDMKELSRKPLITLIINLKRGSNPFLVDRLILSLFNQIYSKWKLEIINSDPDNKKIKNIVEIWKKMDNRIREIEAGDDISDKINKVIRQTEGEWILFHDGKGEYSSFSFFEIAKAINQKPEAGIIYFDEDIIEGNEKEKILFSSRIGRRICFCL